MKPPHSPRTGLNIHFIEIKRYSTDRLLSASYAQQGHSALTSQVDSFALFQRWPASSDVTRCTTMAESSPGRGSFAHRSILTLPDRAVNYGFVAADKPRHMILWQREKESFANVKKIYHQQRHSLAFRSSRDARSKVGGRSPNQRAGP
jgi:hypothetical protein